LRFSCVHTPWGLWKTSTANIHVNGRLLLLKSLAKDQDESRTKMTELPQQLSLAETAALLSHLLLIIFSGPRDSKTFSPEALTD
jgi:hypothetical protein